MRETPSPRRYRVIFECSPDEVGTFTGSIIREVQGLTSEPAPDGRYKMSFTCLYDQLPDLILLGKNTSIDHLIVRPHMDEVVSRPVLRPVRDTRLLPTTHIEVTKVPPARRRVKGGAKPSERATGQAVLRVLRRRAIAHAPDFADEFEKSGLSASSVSGILFMMMREGSIVKCGYGAYRLPTTREQLSQIATRTGGVLGEELPVSPPSDALPGE